jgi:hypothetical protein
VKIFIGGILKKNVGIKRVIPTSIMNHYYVQISVKFDYQFEVRVVPVSFELGIDGGFAFVVILLVNRALKVLETVFTITKACIGHSTKVVNFGGLVKAAVEGTDAVLGFVIHELGKGQIVVA